MIITREKGMRMWGGGSGSTSASGVNGGGGFSLAVTEGEGTGNAYTDFTYESGTLTLNKGSEFVTVDFFNKLFTAYDANGNVIAPNNTTPTLDNIKFKAGAWTEQYLSALGQNSSGGGGGGGIELSDVWQSLKTNTDDYANQKINSAHIPDLSGTYATKTWVNQQGFVTSSGVTSVAMTVPTGLSVSGSPITSTGTLALTFTSGYSIPTTAKQSNWDTAYGWGNHATAGYASASSVTTLQGYFTNGVANTAAKLNTGTTTYTAWGQTYWSSGIPQSVSGNMTSVGSITPSANGNALGTTSARFNIYGTAGNFSGNVSIGGTLGVTGATTLTGLLTANGGIVVPSTKTIKIGNCTISWDSTNSMLKFDTGIYSTGAVSALGSNSSGGGSGTFDEEAMWTALGTTSSAKVIASSHIPNLAASKITSGTFADARIPSLAASKITSGTFDTARIPNLAASKITSGTLAAARIPIATASAVGGIKVGTTLAISDGVLNQKSGIATAGTYRSVTVDTYGRVTAGTNPTTLSGYGITNAYTKTQVDNALSGYLPLSGGTMTGSIKMDATNKGYYLVDSAGVSYPALFDNGGYLCIGANATSGTHHTGSTYISAGSGEVYIIRLVNNSRTTYKNLDTGNTYVSSGKGYINGTEITTITGNAATATKATQDGSGNTISSTYLKLSGGTITGNLAVKGYFYLRDNAKALYTTDTANNVQNTLELDSSNNLQIGYGTAGSGYNTYLHGNNLYLRYGTSRTTGIYLNSSGNVGIGTTSPSYKLHVQGTVGMTTAEQGTMRFIAANSTNYIQSGNAAFNGNADMIIGGYNATLGTNLNLDFNIVKATSVLKVKQYLTLGYGAEGIYLTGSGINWHNTSDSWTKSIMSFTSTGATTINGITTISNATQVSGVDDILFVGSDVSGVSAANKGVAIRLGMSSGNYTTKIACVYEQSNPQYLNPAIVFYTMYNTYAKGSEVERMRLSSAGNLTVSGEVTASSDERKKNIISSTKFNVKDIASARSILYEWKDRKDKIHGGSIAQDWIGKADSFLLQDDDGFYSINYGALALCSAITIAREVVKHDDEITRLKKEVVKLRERVAELEERRIA